MIQKSLRGLTPTTFLLTPQALSATLLLKMNREVFNVAHMEVMLPVASNIGKRDLIGCAEKHAVTQRQGKHSGFRRTAEANHHRMGLRPRLLRGSRCSSLPPQTYRSPWGQLAISCCAAGCSHAARNPLGFSQHHGSG